MDIKIPGADCANCNKLEQMVLGVLKYLNAEADVEHAKDR